MTLDLKWGNDEKTFVYTRFYEGWTWREFKDKDDLYYELVGSVEWRVDYVADFTNVSMVPSNVLQNLAYSASRRLPNEGYTIIVHANVIVKQLTRFIGKVLPVLGQSVQFVDTMDEALEIVKSGRTDEATSV